MSTPIVNPAFAPSFYSILKELRDDVIPNNPRYCERVDKLLSESLRDFNPVSAREADLLAEIEELKLTVLALQSPLDASPNA